MVLRYPGAEWRPLGAQAESRMTGHDIVCVHTMIGYVTSTDNFFREVNGKGYSGTESHYGIGGKWGPDLGGNLDGKVWQWQDRAYSADANLEGGHRVISIETADNAKRPIAPWTDKQIDALVKLIAWECSTAAHADCPSSWTCHKVGIPAVLIPDTKPGRRGIGYHRQGCPPSKWNVGEPGWLVPGGVRWSTATGKDCPTATRINQLVNTVIPRVQTTLRGAASKEGDMPTPAEFLELLDDPGVKFRMQAFTWGYKDKDQPSAHDIVLGEMRGSIRTLVAQEAGQAAAIAKLAEAVERLAGGQGLPVDFVAQVREASRAGAEEALQEAVRVDVTVGGTGDSPAG